MSYTKGPWSLHLKEPLVEYYKNSPFPGETTPKDRIAYVREARITDAGGNDVCALDYDGSSIGDRSEEEIRANAALIASAPDLLSVARLAEMCSRANLQDPMQLILLNVQLSNLGVLAKMALAKAEGRDE